MPAPTATAMPAPTATPEPEPTAAMMMPEGEYGGVLNIPLIADIGNRDPSLAGYFFNYGVGANVYSEMLRFNWEPPRDKVLPSLAETWETSSDGMVLTLNFREGVTWHDGEPFTASDAAFSIEMNNGRFAPQLEIIESMDVPDDTTLVLNLTGPKASLPSLLAHTRIIVFGEHTWDAAGGDLTDGPNIGTGPFMVDLDDFNRGVSYGLVRNEDYFLPGLPFLDGIKAFLVGEEGTRLGLFRTGRLDVLGTAASTLNEEQVNDLKGDVPDLQAAPFNALNQLVIVVNSQKSPYDNVNVRRAISLSINRHEMAQLPHVARPSGPLVGPPGWGLSEEEILALPGYGDGDRYLADVEEAKRLLAEAGYPNGLDVEMISSPTSYHRTSQVVLIDHLSRAGIRASGAPVTSAEDVARRNEGNFELNVQGVGLSFPDPDGAFLAVESTLFTKLEDAQISDLFARQSVESDPAARADLVRQLQERMIDQVSIITVGWQQFFWAIQPKVRDLYPPLGWTDSNWDHVWFEE
jgi:ABC-type transport system substrate-binding protein